MTSRQRKIRLAGILAALITLALAVSCKGFFPTPTLSSIAIGPQNLSLSPDQSFQMSATGTFNDGSTSDVTGKSLWSSTNQSVATFSTTAIGKITAASLANIPNPPGTTDVQACDGTICTPSPGIQVTVCPVVNTLVITAVPTSVTAGASVTFTATATFQGVTGNQTVTNQVTWNISNSTVLSSISGGVGTTNAGTTGMTTVSATLCGATSSGVVITVN